MGRLNLPCALLQLAFFRLGAGTFDCNRDCFGPYQDFLFVPSCPAVRSVLDCYNINQDACDDDFNTFFLISQAHNDFGILGCEAEGSVIATDNIVTTEPSEPCPSLPTISAITSMSSAVVFPEPHQPPECTPPRTRVSSLRQCSLFMDSQLRAFDSYRGGLEACSLPGSWYLFHHQSLTIEVEGDSFDTGSNHTRLTRVNVTFHTHECNPTMRTYTVFNSQPLPLDFTPSQLNNSNSHLQILFGADGSVVTLMDTLLNATIVIRKYLEFLSVTLQVPREVSLESEGLCTGCPSHLYINITHFNDLYPSLCPEANTRVLDGCFVHGGVANVDGLVHIMNNSYLDACVYSLFKIGRPSDVLTMFNAIADDAQLLVNVGTDPVPTPTLPTSPLSYTTTQSTPITNSPSTMEVSASTSYHKSRLPLMLLAILCILLHSILVLR